MDLSHVDLIDLIFITPRETPGLTVMDLTYVHPFHPFHPSLGFVVLCLAGWICHGVLNVQSEP